MKRPIWKSFLKWLGILLATLLVLTVLFVCILRSITYFSNHIHTANGIDEGIYVPLGGEEQYLLIRGEDTSNPVMVWLHGGPSSPDAFANYTFQKYLVDDYTVVNWDQRGCGRTYYRNEDADPKNETASFDQAQIDLDALVDYLLDRFHTDKVIIVGHSYGTMLGSKYALEHPHKVAAYVGVGQLVTMESDVYSYEDALAIATSKGDDTSAMKIAYHQFTQDKTLVNMMNLRSLVHPYHIAPREANTLWLGVASPYMGLDDLRWFLKQMGDFDAYVQLNQQLFDYLMVTDVRTYGMVYQMPVGFISGSDDWTTPVKYVQDYYQAVSAPSKEIALIDGCGHSPQYDAPEEFCQALKDILQQ
jgi:pimeloyl-ACP methyl ester carboxylesterase